MKKFVCIILGLMLVSSAFCQESEESVKPQVEFLINQNLKKNKDSISNLSLQLTNNEKIELFNSYKKNSGIPLVLNTVVGFGLGSYINGDILGGVIGSCLDGAGVIGWILAAEDYNSRLTAYSAYKRGESYKYNGKEIHFEPDFWESASIPFLITAAARIYEGIRATTYVKRFNKDLTNALGLDSLYTSFLPVFDYDGNLAMAFDVTIKL